MTYTWFFPNPNGAFGEAATSDPTADPVTHAISLIAASLALTGATAATVVESTKVTGDAANRLTIGADGKLSWGSGSGAVDTVLSRTAASELSLAAGDTFKADTITVNGTETAAIVNALTGYQLAGAATSGQYLRGNGTNFVSAAVLDADLPATITRDSEVFRLPGYTTKGDIAVATAAGVVARQGVGADGTVLRADSTQGTGVAWTTPKIPSVQSRFTSGDRTLNSTAWADMNGSSFDVTLTGVTAGDVIEGQIIAYTGSEAVIAYFDLFAVTGSHYFLSGGSTSDPGMGGSFSGAGTCTSTTYAYTTVSGDLSAGSFTARPRYRTSAATNKTGFASTTLPLIVRLRNLGQ